MRNSRWRTGLAMGLAMIATVGVTGLSPAASASSKSPLLATLATSHALPVGLPGMPERPVIKVGDSSELDGVFCLTAANCWAVGYFVHGGALLDLVLHWTGVKWSQVSAPSPGGTASMSDSQLSSVRCTSKANCWAVGYYDNSGAELSEALHWNGTKWRRVDTPSPGGPLTGDVSPLMDVACTAPGNCWADGNYGQSSTVTKLERLQNFVLHWNGQKWSLTTVPNPAGSTMGDLNAIDAIRCTSPANCWAIGTRGKISKTTIQLLNEILYWNGKKWTEHSAPSYTKGKLRENVLQGLSCLSASNCWASGITTAKHGFVNETQHWNGHQWQNIATPSPKGVAQLTAISCPSAKDCWTVGSVITPSDGTLNQALHWTGHKWFPVTMPQPAGTVTGDVGMLMSLRCTSGSNCWAVGLEQAAAQPELGQILHWNGAKWVAG